jgi:protein-L-isoaspartate(D-aspartate) O-methyltransferase
MDLSDKKRMLLESLRREGCLRSPGIVRAFMDVPREGFVRPEDMPHAYSDQPLHIGSGQTISAPHMVAIMTELIRPGKADRVLEVGAGSGYQAAILSRLVRRVYAMELEPGLVSLARKNLKRAGIRNVEVVQGDGSLGLPEHAPYDRIMVTCAADMIYPAWKEQLREGGILIAPVDSGFHQELTLAEKKKGRLRAREILSCVFVPLRHR